MRQNTLDRLLRNHGLKATPERKLLFEEIQDLKHFDAESLFLKLKKKKVPIARDTVYRTLPLFLEMGLLQKSVGQGHREYFEWVGTKGHHDHLLCVVCGKVVEFHSAEIEALQEQICKEAGFELSFHDHRLFGRCSKCKKKT